MQVTLYESVLQRHVTNRTALVAFGANLPPPGRALQDVLTDARDALSSGGLALTAFSRMFRTPAFPAGSGEDYLNAVAAFSVPAELGAEPILARLHAVEAKAGRTRSTRWGARVLDLDLLALDDLVLPDAETQDRWRALPLADQMRMAPDRLILPHPRLQDRAFVLVPMADVAPDWRHPRLGRTVREMLAALPPDEVAAVTPL
jgi:2-amino-4-hydroxy-6-hydroxymethyldihydropteridine diphosphokinase